MDRTGGRLCGAVRYRSSAAAALGFCPRCGATLSMHGAVPADRVQVTLRSLDAPEAARIDDHVWTEDRIAWLKIDDGLPHVARSSNAVPTDAPQRASRR